MKRPDKGTDINNNPIFTETNDIHDSVHHFRIPITCRQLSYYSQWVALILTAILYSRVLVIESRTFGWRGVLDTFGVSVQLKGDRTTSCTYQYHSQFQHNENTENDYFAEYRFLYPHSVNCSYTLEVNRRFWWNLFIVGGATLINLLTNSLNQNLTDVKTYKWLTAVCLLYPLMCIYFLAAIFMNLKNDYQTLPLEMSYELNKRSVLPDAISQWWTNTQTESQCCGLHGPSDWNMEMINYNLFYHKSCYRNPFLDLPVEVPQILPGMFFPMWSVPTTNEIWHDGCLPKEQNKILAYGIIMFSLLLLHTIGGTVLILCKVLETFHENIQQIKFTDYNFYSEKLKSKVFINFQGLHDNSNFTMMYGDRDAGVTFIVYLRNVQPSKDSFTEITHNPWISLGSLFYSKKVLRVSGLDGKIIAEVNIKSTPNVIQGIKTYLDENSRYVVQFAHA